MPNPFDPVVGAPRAANRPLIVPSRDSGVGITVTGPEDPAFALLHDGPTTDPEVYRRGCFICEDPEFARMGLPLCRACPTCSANDAEPGSGHIAADDSVCDVCHRDEETGEVDEDAALAARLNREALGE